MESFDNYLVIPPTELRKLIVQRKEFGTLEALCIDLCGGVSSAGRMLYRLLNWWTKSKHAEGWVYKDFGDWYAELRITQKELPKANAALALAGVEVKLLKGRLDCPRKHYRLLAQGFVKALARVLGLGVEWLKNFCEPFAKSIAPKTASQNRQKGKIEIAKTATPSTGFTTDSSSLLPQNLNNKQQGAADVDLHPESSAPSVCDDAQEGVSAFKENVGHESDSPIPPVSARPLPREIEYVHDKGLPRELAWSYIEKYGEPRCVAAAEHALRPGITSAPGTFRWVLDQTDWYMNTVSPVPAASEVSGKTAEIYEQNDDVTAVEPVPYIDPERAAQWRSAFAQIELQLDRANFDIWLRDARLVGFEDGTFVIGVRNQPAVQMLTYRLNRIVQRVMDDVIGAPTQIRFEVATVRKPRIEEPLFKKLARQ